MASRATEGRREIEAAKKRLAAARAQASAASKAWKSAKGAETSAKETEASARNMAEAAARNTEVATENRKGAEAQVDATGKELQQAEEFLMEAEKRWEVVAIDDEDDGDEKSESNEGNSASGRKKQKTENPSAAEEVVLVEGAGSWRVDGYYRREGEWNGAPEYVMPGRWKLKDVEFHIRRDLSGWCIWVPSCGETLYKAHYTYGEPLPPMTDWEPDEAEAPAPRFKWAPEEIVVAGCGRSEANGTYKRSGMKSGAPCYTHNGEGRLQIYYLSEYKRWFILKGGNGKIEWNFISPLWSKSLPKTGWMLQGPGDHTMPPPQLDW